MKVSGHEWQRRAHTLLGENVALQGYGKKATEDLMAIHKIAVMNHQIAQLFLDPKMAEAWEKVANIAGPYALDVPDIQVKAGKNATTLIVEDANNLKAPAVLGPDGKKAE